MRGKVNEVGPTDALTSWRTMAGRSSFELKSPPITRVGTGREVVDRGRGASDHVNFEWSIAHFCCFSNFPFSISIGPAGGKQVRWILSREREINCNVGEKSTS